MNKNNKKGGTDMKYDSGEVKQDTKECTECGGAMKKKGGYMWMCDNCGYKVPV